MKSSIQVGILNYPNAQASAIYGLIDLFETANRLQQERFDAGNCPAPLFAVERLSSLDSRQLSVIIIPPCLGELTPEKELTPLACRLPDLYHEGTLICSICAGAFILGRSGLLDGRPATTHWALHDKFTSSFPKVILNTDQLVIDDGDIITAGGVMAWVDLGLRIIDRFLGTSIMVAVARFFLVDPGGREQRFYSHFSPRLTHGDKAILKAQHWLQAHSHEAVTVPMMAEVAKLGGRTFIRRFHTATGLNPSEYLQFLRVGKAKEMLETSRSSVEEIAWQAGYEDASAFRRVFQKLAGLTPREYRNRFTLSSGVNQAEST
ncbi:GlxA family transcriptional regulator [Endozoicomonadaceae bacterium StTr2]